MTFSLATSGSCAECTWISASGIITDETPDDFLAFVSSLPGHDPSGLTVHLDSQGGSLYDAIRLGDLFRLKGVSTAPSRTVGEVDTYGVIKVAEAAPETSTSIGACASACVLAFAGGAERYALSTTPSSLLGGQPIGALLIHRFITGDALGAEVDGAKLPLEPSDLRPVSTSDVLDYLTRMGVSAELLQLTSSVPAATLSALSDPRILRSGLDTRAPTSIRIHGYTNGVGVVEVSLKRRTGEYDLEFYCDAGKSKLLAHASWHASMEPDFAQNMGLLQGLVLNGAHSLVVEDAEYSSPEGGQRSTATVRFEIDGLSPDKLGQLSALSFEDDAGQDAADVARDLGFEIPDNFGAFHLLKRTCL